MAIDDAGDPAHCLRAASGQKKDALGKLPERVAVWVQHPANLFLERRDPFGIGSIKTPWQVNEVL
jgi:hypothetical protein